MSTKCTILLMLFPFLCFGQYKINTALNSLELQQGKESYGEIKGSPYLFNDWVKADLFHLEKSKVEGAMLRLDLNQNNLEVKAAGLMLVDEDIIEVNNERFIVLADNYYKRIVISKKDNPKAFKGMDVDTVLLMKGIHKDYIDKYAIVLYNGEKVKLVKTINVIFRETKFNTPGKIEKIKKFNRKTGYALIIEKEKFEVKLKDKEFYKVLGHKDELKAFVKANKIKLKKESSFVKLLDHWESLE